MVLGGCSSQRKNGKTNQKVLRIGVSSYDQYDTFVSELISCFQNYAKEKEKEWEITISLDIRYAQRSQMVQNSQMDDFMMIRWILPALILWIVQMHPVL